MLRARLAYVLCDLFKYEKCRAPGMERVYQWFADNTAEMSERYLAREKGSLPMPPSEPISGEATGAIRQGTGEAEQADQAALVALFRLLMREPDHGHDFATCPVCKQYGTSSI